MNHKICKYVILLAGGLLPSTCGINCQYQKPRACETLWNSIFFCFFLQIKPIYKISLSTIKKINVKYNSKMFSHYITYRATCIFLPLVPSIQIHKTHRLLLDRDNAVQNWYYHLHVCKVM